MWGMFYHRLNPKATADAQCPLIVDRRMVILVQIVPNAAVSLVWALPVDLLHQLGDALILGDAAPGCPGAPLVIAGSARPQPRRSSNPAGPTSCYSFTQLGSVCPASWCACATSWSARPPSRQASTASSRSSMVWSFLMIVPPLSLLEFLS